MGSGVRVVGILIVLGVGYYVYSMHAQSRDVEELCSTYVKGTRADEILEVAQDYSGQLMGPIESTNKDDTYSFIYCAPVTMCDVSCSIEVEDGVVTKSDFRSL
jgi:hypothetical protein